MAKLSPPRGVRAKSSAVSGDFPDLQEQFSVAYVKAVAAVAGFYAQEARPSKDKDGVDLTISKRGYMGVTQSPELDIQAKSHLGDVPSIDPWKYDLKTSSYNKLRATPYQVPRILVVVMMPKDVKEWLHHTPHHQLVLRRCAYWRYLVGEPETPNTSTVRIAMPLNQILDVDGLIRIMNNVANKNAPM